MRQPLIFCGTNLQNDLISMPVHKPDFALASFKVHGTIFELITMILKMRQPLRLCASLLQSYSNCITSSWDNI